MTRDRERLSHQERREQTKGRLIEAALEVFAEVGFRKTRLEDVASRAGYTKGAIYSNFSSKDDLAQAVLVHYNEKEAQDFDSVHEGFGPHPKFWIDLARNNATDVRRLLAMELWAKAWHDDELREALTRQRRTELDALARVLASGAEPLKAHHDAVQAINAMLAGVAMQYAVEPDPSLLEQFADFAVKTLRDLNN